MDWLAWVVGDLLLSAAKTGLLCLGVYAGLQHARKHKQQRQLPPAPPTPREQALPRPSKPMRRY